MAQNSLRSTKCECNVFNAINNMQNKKRKKKKEVNNKNNICPINRT